LIQTRARQLLPRGRCAGEIEKVLEGRLVPFPKMVSMAASPNFDGTKAVENGAIILALK
jgi:hypothetical protein